MKHHGPPSGLLKPKEQARGLWLVIEGLSMKLGLSLSRKVGKLAENLTRLKIGELWMILGLCAEICNQFTTQEAP